MSGAGHSFACPFCGETNLSIEEIEHRVADVLTHLRVSIRCESCRATGPRFYAVSTGSKEVRQRAVTAWERRARLELTDVSRVQQAQALATKRRKRVKPKMTASGFSPAQVRALEMLPISSAEFFRSTHAKTRSFLRQHGLIEERGGKVWRCGDGGGCTTRADSR